MKSQRPLRSPDPSVTVHKFGGAALADAAAIGHAVRIIAAHAEKPTLVVASAMHGVTDALLDIARRASSGEVGHATLTRLRERHVAAATASATNGRVDPNGQVRSDVRANPEVLAQIDETFDDLAGMCRDIEQRRQLTGAMTDAFIAHGDSLAARLLTAALHASDIAAEFVDATRVVHADARHGSASPDIESTARAAAEVLQPILGRGVVPVVPGFIGRAPTGELVTLGRGGSDLTATLLGRVLHARDVILWKDVPGLLTADPRIVPEARLIPVLHVREASELAYYGAKVLHPRALIALHEGTRLFIRPFADPEAAGTEIVVQRTVKGGNGRAARRPVKALTAIADQALVTIAGNGMVGVPGIAARAFGALERASVSVSLISQASSEHSICMGIPAAAASAAAAALRDAFAAELARGEIDGIDVRPDLATIAVVGLGMAGTPGVAARLFTALADAGINVVAIAQGASELNISVVVEGRDAAAAQRAVHAAFRLDKIGGGTAVRPTHADVVILGFGQIGRELATQLASHGTQAGDQGRARVVAVVDRTGYVFDARGLSAKRLATLAAAKAARTPLAGMPRGVRASAEEALGAISAHALSRPILVDVTAGDTGPVLEAAVTRGMDLVLANKRPLAAPAQATRALARAAASRGRRVLHEATVGAGLPIIDTIQKLTESGDRVLRIEGCPSGTLGYLFGEMGRGTPFSSALRAAMKLGYTEPDPRDDLSGMDVARKALILGRLIGFPGELADVHVESLVPDALRDLPLDAFLARVHEVDALWEKRVQDAREHGAVLRYRATVTKRDARVGVVAVDAASSLASLTGTDNQFAFTTRRYRTNPLVITGPGAGAAVTAAGVLNDVLKLAGTR
jgi:bifunctional aspartokinase / homoserine dehydrogenase 1